MDTKQKSTYWSVTINNPTNDDEENIQQARQRRWKVDGQLEQGEQGTRHYQLIVHTPDCPRFSMLKKAFPRAHIEPAKNPKALQNYVQKEETRIGELPETNEMYPSLSKLWDLIYDMYQDDFYYNEYGLDFREARVKREWTDYPYLPFDRAINELIKEGYHVETIAINPQTRAAWVKYWPAIMVRSLKSKHKINGVQETSESTSTSEIPTSPETDSP